VTALDIVTVDHAGRLKSVEQIDSTIPIFCVPAAAPAEATFGIITNFYFDTLPKTQSKLCVEASASVGRNDRERFARILYLFSNYWRRGQGSGLHGDSFSISVWHIASSGHLAMSVSLPIPMEL